MVGKALNSWHTSYAAQFVAPTPHDSTTLTQHRTVRARLTKSTASWTNAGHADGEVEKHTGYLRKSNRGASYTLQAKSAYTFPDGESLCSRCLLLSFCYSSLVMQPCVVNWLTLSSCENAEADFDADGTPDACASTIPARRSRSAQHAHAVVSQIT
jgi:hypothetical protein